MMMRIWIIIQIWTPYIKDMYKQNYQYNISEVLIKDYNFHKFNTYTLSVYCLTCEVCHRLNLDN